MEDIWNPDIDMDQFHKELEMVSQIVAENNDMEIIKKSQSNQKKSW